MAFPTTVNPQITDAARSRTHAALGDVLVSLSQNTALLCQNAVAAQQRALATAQETTTQGVSTIYGIDLSAPTGVATERTV
ncbi:RebB family R body protein [Myxococcota bacterium]|nr:RebB family R body protein [Myxococcota bacterium]